MDARTILPIGISAISLHQPPWELENDWFGDTMPRKFAHHTGIEARAISLGYDTDHYKLVALVITGALAGPGGATKAPVFQLATLTDVPWSMSGEVVLMTLVGGMGTLFGPVVGAAVIVTMQNYLAHLGAWVTVVQGVIFVLCVLAFRRGLVGEIAHKLKKSL